MVAVNDEQKLDERNPQTTEHDKGVEGLTHAGQDTDPFPYHDVVIGDTSASFDMVVEAYFARREVLRGGSHARSQPEYQERSKHYLKVLDAFQSRHGTISSLYYCSRIKAGAARTDKDKDDIFVSCHAINSGMYPEHASNFLTGTDIDPHIESLLFRCKMLHTASNRLLSGHDRQICGSLCYSLIVHLLGLADGSYQQTTAHDGTDRASKTVQFLENELRHAERYHVESAERRAQIQYTVGMVCGALFLLAVTFPLNRLLHLSIVGITTPQYLIDSFIGGAIGAVISVMSRISFQKCTLDYTAGKFILWLLGAFRPVIGAVFGVVFCVMSEGKVLPLAPQSTDVAPYFYSGLAFIAGFSERWAQDMLVMGARGISTQPQEQDQPGHASSPGAGHTITTMKPRRHADRGVRLDVGDNLGTSASIQ